MAVEALKKKGRARGSATETTPASTTASSEKIEPSAPSDTLHSQAFMVTSRVAGHLEGVHASLAQVLSGVETLKAQPHVLPFFAVLCNCGEISSNIRRLCDRRRRAVGWEHSCWTHCTPCTIFAENSQRTCEALETETRIFPPNLCQLSTVLLCALIHRYKSSVF